MNSADSSQEKIRLPVFRSLTHLIAVLAGLFYGLYVYFLKDYLPDVRYPGAVFWSLLFAAAYSIAVRLIGKYFKWEKGFYLLNLGWIPVYIGVVYGTGGAKSPFLFLFFIPLITTAWNLDPVVTKRVGIIMLASAALILFADQAYLHSYGFLAQYFLVVSAMGIVMYYIYRLLSETLLQKYEKEEAKKKYDELLEVDRLKTDFLTVVSHQLRTPLTGARWGLSALRGENVSSEAKSLLKQTEDRINDSIAIVNQMVGSIDARVESLRKAKLDVNLDELMREVAGKLKYFINGNRVDFSFGEISPCVILGNEDALSAAFSNIIDNAVRYAPGGKVSVSIAAKDGKAVVTIADTGIGISPEDQPYIFKRFYRGKNALKVEPNGSGIGLYLTKRIVEQHGGTISFSSAIGKGTTVAVALPLKK